MEVVRERARRAIAERGAVIDDPNGAGDGALWGIVASGAFDMVPALVRVTVDVGTAGGARVHVRGTGREGLIKQRIRRQSRRPPPGGDRGWRSLRQFDLLQDCGDEDRWVLPQRRARQGGPGPAGSNQPTVPLRGGKRRPQVSSRRPWETKRA